MYEKYTRQALPDREYRELLGSAICVFNLNTSFLIENILRIDSSNFDWYHLTDLECGKLKKIIQETISVQCNNDDIINLFSELVKRRNRIIHSFQITGENGEQLLSTKEKVNEGNNQFCITKEYLLEFIKLNEEISDLLHKLRGY